MSEELAEDEYKFIRVGNHLICVINNDGRPEITVRDHAEMIIEGEHKGDVTITHTSGEFGATFKNIGEREYWEQFVK